MTGSEWYWFQNISSFSPLGSIGHEVRTAVQEEFCLLVYSIVKCLQVSWRFRGKCHHRVVRWKSTSVSEEHATIVQSAGRLLAFRMNMPSLFSGLKCKPSKEASWSRQKALRRYIQQNATLPILGRAVAQAVRRWLPTAAARVRVRAACGVCGGQCGTEAGFLGVLRFPLPIIPPISPLS
jgi:hypothetical protein